MIADLLIVGSTIMDGIWCPGYRADVAVRDGKIADVAMIASCADTPTLDAADLVGTQASLLSLPALAPAQRSKQQRLL